MESSFGEMDKIGEDLTGRKKSRFKQLKTRLFGRLKKKESEGQIKQSQSASDITVPEGIREGYDSEDEFSFPQGLSSRALSHDSIFIHDQTPSTEPTRVLSQENVHGKIKALQLKLAQQNLHLGPPPMLIPGKRIEDSGTTSEDDGLPCSPPEMSFHERVMHGAVYKYPESQKHLSSLSLAGTGSEEEGDPFQPSSRPLSPVSRPSSQPIISPVSSSTTPTAGVDFSSPAGYMPRLDNSAARHRMSVKPRNQRASTRGKRGPPVSLSPRHRSESISDLDNVLSEEEDETMTSTETVHHCLYPSPTSELTEKPTSPEPTETTPEKSAQDHENPNRAEINFSSQGVEIFKSEESLETEVRATTNPLYLQPVSFGLISSGPPSPSGLLESTPSSREMESLRAHSPIQRHDTNDIQIGTSENLVSGTDKNKSIQEEATFRLYPAPLPHLTKPKIDKRSPPSPKGVTEASTKPWDAGIETAPELVGRTLNAGSSQFLIASAKYRSKTTTETKQIEGHMKQSQGIKTQVNKPNPELQKDEARETKPTEFQNLLHQTQERKSSFRREVPPPIMSKPITGTNRQKPADTTTEHVEIEKLEEPEDRKNAFGVQLRTTSMSLKYRSEVSKIKDETKRYSLESNTVTEVSEEHFGKAETFRNMSESNSKSKPSVPKKLELQNLDSPLAAQDNGRPSIQNTTGASKEVVSEPGWMSLAREKTRAYQPFLGRLVPNQSPVHPTSPTAPPAQPPKPALQPKTQLMTSSLHPMKTASLQTSQRPPTKPAPSGTKDWQDKSRNSTPEDDSTKRAARPTAPAPNSNTEVALSISPEPPTTSSSSQTDVSQQQQQQQQPRPDGAQPSWMELAKRKSLAWSDKTLE
ncbi:uncharacterized protein cracdlb [Garra rufa]|uniref:uncharacterized protein cracdlb n=1 Tax=Garra rufa TaxID=137080 RepID=UPI003CCEBFB9